MHTSYKGALVNDGSGCQLRMERDQKLRGLTCLGIEPGRIGKIEQQARRERTHAQDISRTTSAGSVAAPGLSKEIQEASRFSW